MTIIRMGRRPKGAPEPDPREKFTTTLPPDLVAWAKATYGNRGVGALIEDYLTGLRTAQQDAELLAQAKARKEP